MSWQYPVNPVSGFARISERFHRKTVSCSYTVYDEVIDVIDHVTQVTQDVDDAAAEAIRGMR